jgi:hypothetical protein
LDNGEKAGSVFAVVQTHICPQPVGQRPHNSEAEPRCHRQAGEALPPAEPWSSMANTGSW